jgi:hypothetical protein
VTRFRDRIERAHERPATDAGAIAARLCEIDADLARVAPAVRRWLRVAPAVRGPVPPMAPDVEPRVLGLLDEMRALVAKF